MKFLLIFAVLSVLATLFATALLRGGARKNEAEDESALAPGVERKPPVRVHSAGGRARPRLSAVPKSKLR